MSGVSSAQGARRAPKHAPRAPFALLVGGLVGGSMCALLALNTASAANEVSRHDLAVKDASVSDSLVQLNSEVAASAAPQNLAAAAANLGMVPAGNPAFLVVGADGKVNLLGSPGATVASPTYMPPATTASSPSAPKSSISPSAKSTTSKSKSTTSKSKSKSKSKSTKARSGHSDSSKRKHATKTVAATPTATPTPNSILPGGTR